MSQARSGLTSSLELVRFQIILRGKPSKNCVLQDPCLILWIGVGNVIMFEGLCAARMLLVVPPGTRIDILCILSAIEYVPSVHSLGSFHCSNLQGSVSFL